MGSNLDHTEVNMDCDKSKGSEKSNEEDEEKFNWQTTIDKKSIPCLKFVKLEFRHSPRV
jgi:hypothetical protein